MSEKVKEVAPLRFLKNAKPASTSEPYYDLFEGGYISPYDLLEEEDAERVAEAISLIEQFLSEAEAAEFLGYF